jgi:hypothetical protein
VGSTKPEVVVVKWTALLLPPLIVGCTPRGRQSHDFVAYVQSARHGSRERALRYDLDAGQRELLAEAGEVGLRIQPLPAREWWFYGPPTETERHRTKAVPFEPVYIDAYTGAKLEPDARLGLGDGRRALIDLLEGRALVAQRGADTDAATGRLLLYDQVGRHELGQVFLERVIDTHIARHLALSPDRKRLAWSGPKGAFLADLVTGNVQRRPYDYDWQLVLGKPPKHRTFRWLPDGSGFIEQRWIAGKPHWEMFRPDGEGPVATGEGRIQEISPDCSYWAIVNEASGSFPRVKPDRAPRLLRPVPLHQPALRARLVTDSWVVSGGNVWFVRSYPVTEREWTYCVLTPTGYTGVERAGSLPGPLDVLSPEDGGRIGVMVHVPPPSPYGQPAAGPVAIGVFDFLGKERLRIPCRAHPQTLAIPEANQVALADRGNDGWQVRLTDVLTGKSKVVLRVQAYEVRVVRAGERHLIAGAEELSQHWRGDLYAGGTDGRGWRRIAKDVCDFPITTRTTWQDYWKGV